MDELFGVLVEKLEALGLRENTMIILTSDHALYGKGTCYDAGTKSLTMVSWPERIKGGGYSNALLSAIDHYPTILEAVGVEAISEVDGLSYLPVLMGSEEPIHDEIFFELGDMRGIRTLSFKYIARRPILKSSWEAMPQTPLVKEAKRIHDYYFRDFNRYLADTWSGRSGTDFYITHAANFFNRDQLYYLDNDPDELDNLAGNTDYADVLGDLQERLSEWLELMPGGVYPL
jgi:arylsulfatase A-like enzyme